MPQRITPGAQPPIGSLPLPIPPPSYRNLALPQALSWLYVSAGDPDEKKLRSGAHKRSRASSVCLVAPDPGIELRQYFDREVLVLADGRLRRQEWTARLRRHAPRLIGLQIRDPARIGGAPRDGLGQLPTFRWVQVQCWTLQPRRHHLPHHVGVLQGQVNE